MSQKTVLVIEDSHDLAESLQDLLTMHGHEALIALTGKEGVSLALAHHPDLIILDIRLPDISGYEVHKRLRDDEWGKDARIMVLSASESVANIAKNLNLPADQVLFKPTTSINVLIGCIEKRLEE